MITTKKPSLKNELRVERVDDIPLIIKTLQKIGLGDLLDNIIPRHKNWEGLSVGKVAEIWMSYIISEGDHRLNKLEDWVMERAVLFGALYENEQIKRTDFIDDKLALILDYFDSNEYWLGIESGINGKIFSVYKINNEAPGMPVVRLDATVAKGYRPIEEGGIYQFGASKHFNSSLPQFKVMMSTLDSEINGFAYPVASMIVPGNTADDVLYIPMLEQTKKSLGSTDALLIVGDKKQGSKSNRAYIELGGDYYLSPLSEKQVPAETLKSVVKENEEKSKNVILEQKAVGKGFEYTEQMSISIEKQGKIILVEWQERRFVFQSIGHAKSQVTAFDKKIKTTIDQLENLLLSKQGKKTPKTQQEIQQAVAGILNEAKLEEYINVEILTTTQTKRVRGYKGEKGKTLKENKFDLSITLNTEKIEEYKSLSGWCVYATNAPAKKMKLKDAISMYRGQFQIESRFNDLKNKVTKLMPVFLQKESRVRSLVNFMMIGLKIICSIEITVGRKLNKGKEKLKGIYSGNPKRGTHRPTAKMMLSRLKGISVSIFYENGKPKFTGLTPLDSVQIKILRLLGFKRDIYTELIDKMNFNFST